ncbi:sensor histidine kinase [Phytoactinopolyspora limicola]|uniref:sensor histidine kinase n=1 Tax=Phytoactinopolyspora limicola TaxID=2715536 RepID=UPI00140B7925|nr:HAMP domain-containing sensor histidine kinase [Phytoactinopolyspora limicola]
MSDVVRTEAVHPVRSGPRTIHVVLTAVPAVAGIVAAAAVYGTDAAARLTVWAHLWAAILVAGLLATALVMVPVLIRARMSHVRAEAAAAAEQVATANHHRFMLRLDHELKNPVTAMQVGIANLSGVLEESADRRASSVVESVATQAQRIADLVADLRKLAELETRPIEQDSVDLPDLLDEVRDAAKELDGAERRSITLTVPQAPWPLSPVAGDRDLLFLAFYNLLANSVKFTSDDDHIELRAHDDQAYVVVEVADTGIGIPFEEVGQVWDELARGQAARGTPGMGLGLAMVRAVIVRHGGTVALRSRDGHGTVVTVRLPASVPSAP